MPREARLGIYAPAEERPGKPPPALLSGARKVREIPLLSRVIHIDGTPERARSRRGELSVLKPSSAICAGVRRCSCVIRLS